MDKTKKYNVLGYAIAIVGVSMLMLNAVSYLFHDYAGHPAFINIGVALALTGAAVDCKTDKQAG